MIGNNHIAVMEAAQHRLYLYEIDLSNSPEIRLVKPLEKFNNTNFFFSLPRKVHHLFDSLYVFKNEFDVILNLVSFSNDKLTFIKKLKPEGNLITAPDLIPRSFSGKRYFYLENRILFRETFNVNTLEYENKTPVLNLLGMEYNIDTDSNYIAYYRNDSLFVYSIDKEEIIYKQSIAPIKNFIPGFISPPYIYFHQVKTITDVSKENYPTQFILHQNYPNPFNPSTTIEFVVPNIVPKYSSLLQHVTLTIYDVLGKEIARLIDEFKLPGKYSVQFSPPSKISSTVYFYRLKIGDFTDVKKMIFIK